MKQVCEIYDNAFKEKGQIKNSLVQENYHKLTLNLNLDGIWFVKKKLD